VIDAAARKRIEQALTAFCGPDSARAAAFAALSAPDAILGVNARRLMPAASVAKLAVALAAADMISAGAIEPERRIAVRDAPPTRYCSVLKAFDEQTTLSLREVVSLALITSDNPLMVKLMQLTPFAAIQNALSDSGALDTAIVAGFSEEELGPANRVNVTTTADCIALLTAMTREPRYDFVRVALENNLRNTRIPRLLPDDAIVAHKTGTLAGVVNDIGIVSGAHPFAIAFLTDGQTDPWATEHDIATASLAVYEALN
jgi:beta-lactamase class A